MSSVSRCVSVVWGTVNEVIIRDPRRPISVDFTSDSSALAAVVELVGHKPIDPIPSSNLHKNLLQKNYVHPKDISKLAMYPWNAKRISQIEKGREELIPFLNC